MNDSAPVNCSGRELAVSPAAQQEQVQEMRAYRAQQAKQLNDTLSEFAASDPNLTPQTSAAEQFQLSSVDLYFALRQYQNCIAQNILSVCNANTNQSYQGVDYIRAYLKAGGSLDALQAVASIGGSLFQAASSKPIDWRGLIPGVGCYRSVTGSAGFGNVASCALDLTILGKGVSTLAKLGIESDLAAPEFDIHPRVLGQLQDPRLGSLQGQLTTGDLQELIASPDAQYLFDARSGNINIIQDVDGVLLRITSASDEFKIISVGPIRANQVANLIKGGYFIPIGGGN